MPGLDEAAAAFDAVIQSEPGKTAGKPPKPDSGPAEQIFRNVGELEVDEESPEKGGGDDDDIEELLYGRKSEKAKKDTGDSERRDAKDRKDDDSDESDGEADPDGDDDGDESPDEEPDEEEGEDAALLSRKVEVTIDGEPAEVTVKEALEGYVRTQTFHQRMNQLDEAKKIVRRAAGDAVQNYEYSMTIAKQMEEHMKALIPPEPNWDDEFKKDPVHAREMQRYYEKANAFKAAIKTQMDDAAKKMNESNINQMAAFAEEEAAKFDSANRKHWTDPKKKAKDLQSMRKTALSTGFSEEELSQVYDSRMLMVLLKASKYDRMMAARPKPVVRQQAKPIPPGAGSAKQRTAQKGVSSAMKRLNRTGSLEDAAVVMDQIIARG
jgi:hypothetical protein